MDNEDIIQIIEIENIENGKYKQQLIKIQKEINTALFNLKDNLLYQNILNKISSIITIIINITAIKIEKTKQLYESFLRRDEQTIRNLYKNLFTQKLLKDSFENKIRLFRIKEKEYELIKEKTGAYVKDGQVIYNKQKDNEIIILRQENSNLKEMMENYEKLIKEKDILYENLNNKYNLIKKTSYKKINHKKISIPNININLNDSDYNFINSENIYHCPINKEKTQKLLNNSHIKKDYSNFNYLKFKNISKIKNIPLNNCLTSRNFLQTSSDDKNQNEIYLKRLNNSKIKVKSDLYINSDSPNDLSSIKRRPLKMNETLNLKKQKINLLQAYASWSSKNINKFNASKRLINYFKEDISTSFHIKNDKSKKNNTTKIKSISNKKKKNRNPSESENIHKSYLSNIPFNNYKKNIKYTKEISKTNRENKDKKNSDEVSDIKINSKKYCNIDTKKIFHKNIIKKGEFT